MYEFYSVINRLKETDVALREIIIKNSENPYMWVGICIFILVMSQVVFSQLRDK